MIFWEISLYPGLNCIKMDPKQLKIKYTVAHSIPGRNAQKKIKSSIRPGVLYAGYMKIQKAKNVGFPAKNKEKIYYWTLKLPEEF